MNAKANWNRGTATVIGAAGACLGILCSCGCRGVQSVLDPAGPQAARIAALWWFLFFICLAIFILVIAFLGYAARTATRRAVEAERSQAEPQHLATAASSPSDASVGRGVTISVAVTIVIIFAFLIVSVWTGRRLSLISRSNALTIEVIGHQWWWEVRYDNAAPSQIVTTANEIHVPVGQPVLLKTTSGDVIHSFWAPNLHGKKDLIPGRVNTTWIQVDKPGVFRGQCAEFCGFQHAHMAFFIVAEAPEKFTAWLQHQIEPAADPVTHKQFGATGVSLVGVRRVSHDSRHW